jgi:hypothetical protein
VTFESDFGDEEVIMLSFFCLLMILLNLNARVGILQILGPLREL